MLRTLHSDPHVTVTLDERDNVVRYVRSAEPYASIEAARALHDTLVAAIAALPRGKRALLVDVRAAPPRNDEVFEKAITKAMDGLFEHFSAHAVIVKSAVGKLQIQRLTKNRGDKGATVFSSEAEAIEYLKGK